MKTEINKIIVSSFTEKVHEVNAHLEEICTEKRYNDNYSQ